MAHLYKTFFDPSLLVLWADKPTDGSKNARLSFGFRDGRPRMTVGTGAPGAQGLVIYPSDVPNLTAMMLYLAEVATGPADNRITNESLAHVYVDDRQTAEKKVKSALIVGKTKEGMVYITVVAEGFAKIVFPFKPSDYHIFRDNSKNVLSPADVSVKLALAYSEQVRLAISQAVMQHACEEYDSGERKLTSIDRPGNAQGSASPNKANATKFDNLDDLSL